MGNSRSLAFWSAMDAESSSFQYYAGDRTPENREKYEMSCARTRSALKSLPFDYEEIGADRYGVTWSILNMYENYAAARDAFLEMEEGAPDYLDRLYTIYRVQGYLATHAGRLEQMTVESGNERYEMQRPLFIIVPAVSILWGAAALLMVRWLNRSVQRNIVRPMVELAEDSRRIGENDFTGPDTHAEGGDEIASLVRAFCTMKASTRGYIEALTEKHKMEKQLDEVRLQMLKNQINPHFLFNTLNMIASTAQIEDAAATEKMIHALSRLFRYNLKSTDSVMPLERELKVVQDYMYIQQMRFGSRISHDLRVEVDGSETMIPAFTLQPLVENAIIHGIARKEEGGRIFLRIWKQKDKLVISLADTGVGMDEETLKRLMDALKGHRPARLGIGLGNIYQRIKSMYEDGGLRIYSRAGKGTVVQIILPAVREEDYQKI